MRAVFMGTPEFAVGALDSLVAAGHEVALVITQPDKPKGRTKTPTPPPVKARALESSGGVLAVQTGDGVLEILELQMEGKKRMDAEAFLRGHRIGKGTVLGQ